MHIEHPVFKKPVNENIKIWRYMDFTKLIDIFERECLFFTRSDLFEDPFEGVHPKSTIEQRTNELTEVWKNVEPEVREMSLQSISRFDEKIREWTIVNCWHLNEHESDAMWKLYLKSNEGIAIQSTYKKLCNSFLDTKKEVFIGAVDYIDYEKDITSAFNTFTPFVNKRKSFEHERELRAIIQDFPIADDRIDESANLYEYGLYIPVDLNVLIENIYVAPNAPKWITELVESVLKRYGLEGKCVIQSNLLKRQSY